MAKEQEVGTGQWQVRLSSKLLCIEGENLSQGEGMVFFQAKEGGKSFSVKGCSDGKRVLINEEEVAASCQAVLSYTLSFEGKPCKNRGLLMQNPYLKEGCVPWGYVTGGEDIYDCPL
ncbi:MAG: hypothetical protein IIZ39_13710, partial [Blautia sp.]|nr:hypothetical protein [Blautia sp.]